MMEDNAGKYVGHNTFTFNGDVIFSSDFDNGNLARVERNAANLNEFKIWTAPDNMGTSYQSKNGFWFFFSITGLRAGSKLKIQIANASNHASLYKHDMRPVYKIGVNGQRWFRIRSPVKFVRDVDGNGPQLFFEQVLDSDDMIYFAFTYPYTCTMLENDLRVFDSHANDLQDKSGIYMQRECATYSCDGRRIELLTITSNAGVSPDGQREPMLPGLFPASGRGDSSGSKDRPYVFPQKDVVFISARVHPGEVPASHTFKGILEFLLDCDDRIAQALRDKYVFKMIPILNPDGVFRGHCRMDQFGENLNRYYSNPQPGHHPSIFAAKTLIDFYAGQGKLSMYLDCHAHASKRGCFIYGNVMDSIEDQVQNQLLCRLIALNTPYFDYEGCLFSREHMTRIDPGDMAKGLTAEGSGRVNTYLSHGIIHSYTLECNYNASKTGNEVPPTERDARGHYTSPASAYTTCPDRYTPHSWASVGRACVVAILDLRGHNLCSRVPNSKPKSLERMRQLVNGEVRSRKEFKGGNGNGKRRNSTGVRDVRRGSAPASRYIGTGALDAPAWRRSVFESPSQEASSITSSVIHNDVTTAPTPATHVIEPSDRILHMKGQNNDHDSRPASNQARTAFPHVQKGDSDSCISDQRRRFLAESNRHSDKQILLSTSGRTSRSDSGRSIGSEYSNDNVDDNDDHRNGHGQAYGAGTAASSSGGGIAVMERGSAKLTEDDIVKAKENALILNGNAGNAGASAHTLTKKEGLPEHNTMTKFNMSNLSARLLNKNGAVNALPTRSLFQARRRSTELLLARAVGLGGDDHEDTSVSLFQDPKSGRRDPQERHGSVLQSKSSRTVVNGPAHVIAGKYTSELIDKKIEIDALEVNQKIQAASLRHQQPQRPMQRPTHSSHRQSQRVFQSSQPQPKVLTIAPRSAASAADENTSISQYLSKRTLGNAGMSALETRSGVQAGVSNGGTPRKASNVKGSSSAGTHGSSKSQMGVQSSKGSIGTAAGNGAPLGTGTAAKPTVERHLLTESAAHHQNQASGIITSVTGENTTHARTAMRNGGVVGADGNAALRSTMHQLPLQPTSYNYDILSASTNTSQSSRFRQTHVGASKDSDSRSPSAPGGSISVSGSLDERMPTSPFKYRDMFADSMNAPAHAEKSVS